MLINVVVSGNFLLWCVDGAAMADWRSWGFKPAELGASNYFVQIIVCIKKPVFITFFGLPASRLQSVFIMPYYSQSERGALKGAP